MRIALETLIMLIAVIVSLAALVLLANQGDAHASLPSDNVNQYCFHYIKGLKGLWYDIHHEGVEETMRKHPPEDEGVSREYALELATEIEGVDPEHAQAWIEKKWNDCVADPHSVRR